MRDSSNSSGYRVGIQDFHRKRRQCIVRSGLADASAGLWARPSPPGTAPATGSAAGGREEGGGMFETPLAVAVALRRYGELFDPRTGSVIGVSRGGRHWSGDPFQPGFLGAVEERTELARRMTARLQPRERLLLVLWY